MTRCVMLERTHRLSDYNLRAMSQPAQHDMIHYLSLSPSLCHLLPSMLQSAQYSVVIHCDVQWAHPSQICQ